MIFSTFVIIFYFKPQSRNKRPITPHGQKIDSPNNPHGGRIGGFVGILVGANVGFFVGALVGLLVGALVGFKVGRLIGRKVGNLNGAHVGFLVGADDVFNNESLDGTSGSGADTIATYDISAKFSGASTSPLN